MSPEEVITEAVWGQDTEHKHDAIAIARRTIRFLDAQGYAIVEKAAA